MLSCTSDEYAPQLKGYYLHNEEGPFKEVKEMIPEFVVPDLTGFKVSKNHSILCY